MHFAKWRDFFVRAIWWCYWGVWTADMASITAGCIYFLTKIVLIYVLHVT